MKKNIIFDLGGVFIDLDMNLMQQKLLALGADPSAFFVKSSAENSSTICNGLSVSHIITNYQIGRMTTDEFVNIILSHCKQGTTAKQVIEAWNSCLVQLPEERLQMVKELRTKGFSTFLLSNINDLHWVYIEHEFFGKDGFRTDDLFDGIFLSHEVHMTKPDPKIYQLVLKQIGCKADDCLFIDDSLPNAEAAQNEGIASEWLDLTKENVTELIGRVEK